jgi:hypothetical protein
MVNPAHQITLTQLSYALDRSRLGIGNSFISRRTGHDLNNIIDYDDSPQPRIRIGSATMNIISRVKEILLTPKQAWPGIEAEETSTVTLYTQYIMILAAIQAVAGFIGMSLFGISTFGVFIRVPVLTGLIQMVLGYGLSLAMVFVVATIADVLAPKFGGQKR